MSEGGVLRTGEGGVFFFLCPGCRESHIVGPTWSFNGDYDRPTFSPSILVNGHRVTKDEQGRWTGEWERDAAGNLIPEICHSFIKDGQIDFLADCSHALAGLTVALEPFSAEEA